MAASEANGCAGVGDALGRLVGRARALGRREGLAGQLGWLAGAGQAAGWEAYFFFSFFYFSFHLFCLNSNLVLQFEFQIGAPNLLELLSIS